jgi:hypothetical protein
MISLIRVNSKDFHVVTPTTGGLVQTVSLRNFLRSPSSLCPTRVRAAVVGVPRGGPNEKPRGSTLAGGWPAESRNNEMNMSLFLRVSLVVSTLLPCPKGQLS